LVVSEAAWCGFRKTKGDTIMKTTKLNNNKPVLYLRLGLIYANIWERRIQDNIFYAVTFERRYRDKAGNWQSTESYNAEDLLILAKLADQAHTKIMELNAG